MTTLLRPRAQARLRRRPQLAALLAATVVAIWLGASPGYGGTRTAALVRFGTPVTVIPYPKGADPVEGPQSEPQMLWAHDGRLLIAAQFERWDCPTGKPRLGSAFNGGDTRMCVWASADHGKHFHIAGGNCCEAGDDPELAQTPNGTLLESLMTNLGPGPGTGSSLSRSLDNGRTWSDDIAVNHQALNDRPFILAESDTNVLLSYTALPGNIFVSRSADGGASFGAPIAATPVPPQIPLTANGEPIVNKPRGEIVLCYGYSSAPAGGLNGVNEDQIHISRSRDHGRTWADETAVTTPVGFGGLGILSLSSDAAGTEYLTYYSPVGTHGVGVFLTSSTRDRHWSAPVRIDPLSGSAMMSTVRALGVGQLAVAYYHSSSPDALDRTRPWTVDLAYSRDGGKTFTYTPVSHKVTYVGTEIEHHNKIFDLTALTFDPTGHLGVAWGDAGTKAPDNHNVVMFAQQATGAAFGAPRAGTPRSPGPTRQPHGGTRRPASVRSLPVTGASLGALSGLAAVALAGAALLWRRGASS